MNLSCLIKKFVAWWSPKPQPNKSETPRRKRNHLRFTLYRQQYDFSCVPTVLQMVYSYVSRGKYLSHAEAIKKTKCNSTGAMLDEVGKAMVKLCGTSTKRLTTLASVKTALKNGIPVVSNDAITYDSDHATLLCGATKSGVYVADPNTGKITWRSENWLRNVADEFIAIIPPQPRQMKPPIFIKK